MIEVTLTFCEDDIEDILNALKLYEAELSIEDDGSGYTDDVLSNIDSIRGRIQSAVREKLH
jgi:hypothetical protein